MDILTYLKENITNKTPLCEILVTFCKMCEMDLKDCELLFETGVFFVHVRRALLFFTCKAV